MKYKMTVKINKIRHIGTDGWTVAKVVLVDSPEDMVLPTKQVVVTGYIMTANIGDEYEIEGSWINHNIYGWSFAITTATKVLPATIKAITLFLARLTTGVGAAAAKAIVAKYGYDTFSVMDKGDVNEIADLIGEKKAKALVEAYSYERHYQSTLTFVQGVGLSVSIAAKLHEAYGALAVATVQANPYAIVEQYDWLSFGEADKIGATINIAANDARRVDGAVTDYIKKSTADGHYYMYINDIIGNINSHLANYANATNNLTDTDVKLSINRLVDKKTIKIVDNRVYLTSVYGLEQGIATKLTAKIKESHEILPLTIELPNLDDSQRQAVDYALCQSISVLTGGPGTGKTYTTKLIVDALEGAGLTDITLVAPTGRAARRLSESTGRLATTIHRAYQINPDKEHDDINVLYTDVLIIDEASMIDAKMWHLLLSYTRTQRIVIIGDADQLPAIGIGNMLGDMIESDVIPVTRLTTVYRQAGNSQIVNNARAVLNKDVNKYDTSQLTDEYYHIQQSVAINAQKTIVAAYQRMTAKVGADNVQVLTSQKGGALGTEELNVAIQSVINPAVDGKKEVKIGGVIYRVGDRVMQTVNDNDNEVYNGDVGTITDITDDFVEITFGDDDVINYGDDMMADVVLAYAVTTHKSQGSEYGVVITPVHSSMMSQLLTRNMLYTAYTRAKQTLVTVGQLEHIHHVAKHGDAPVRNSQMPNLLSTMLSN